MHFWLSFFTVFLGKPAHGIIYYYTGFVVSGHLADDAGVYEQISGTCQFDQKSACYL
jgi:hypothetical protein